MYATLPGAYQAGNLSLRVQCRYNKALGFPSFKNQSLVWYLKNVNKLHFSFLVLFVCREDVVSFYFLKKRNNLNFRSFCVLNIGEMTLFQKNILLQLY